MPGAIFTYYVVKQLPPVIACITPESWKVLVALVSQATNVMLGKCYMYHKISFQLICSRIFLSLVVTGGTYVLSNRAIDW